jgi:hypothetical protein
MMFAAECVVPSLYKGITIIPSGINRPKKNNALKLKSGRSKNKRSMKHTTHFYFFLPSLQFETNVLFSS